MDWAETWRVVAPMAAPLSGAAIGAWGLLRGSRVVNVGNAVVLVVLVLLAVGVIWGLAYAASQSSGLPAVLLAGQVSDFRHVRSHPVFPRYC